MARSRPKSRRTSSGRKSHKGGLLTGMRRGFKNVAGSVTGTAEPAAKSSWFGKVVTVALLIAALALLLRRFY